MLKMILQLTVIRHYSVLLLIEPLAPVLSIHLRTEVKSKVVTKFV